MEIFHYPINDFDNDDLARKLKGAGDLLNDLLRKGKLVYAHCTAVISRAYIFKLYMKILMLNLQKISFKKNRPAICPNYEVVNSVAGKYKPGSEMWGNKDNIDVNKEMRKMRENNNNLMKMNSNENS